MLSFFINCPRNDVKSSTEAHCDAFKMSDWKNWWKRSKVVWGSEGGSSHGCREKTLVGQLNNLVAPTLWHRLAGMEPPKGLLGRLQAVNVDSFWDSLHWVPKGILFLPKEEGGQGLVHLASRTATFQRIRDNAGPSLCGAEVRAAVLEQKLIRQAEKYVHLLYKKLTEEERSMLKDYQSKKRGKMLCGMVFVGGACIFVLCIRLKM